MHFPEENKGLLHIINWEIFFRLSVKLLFHYKSLHVYQISLRFNQIVYLRNVLYQQAKMSGNKSCYRKLNLSSNLIIQCITYRVLKPTSLYTIKTFHLSS